MTIEIVDFPIENGASFYSYVKLPEGKPGISGLNLVEHEQNMRKIEEDWGKLGD